MDSRSGFLMYNDWSFFFNSMTDEEAGRLIKSMYAYQSTGEKPECEGVIGGVLEFILQQFDADRERYEEVCEKRRAAGKKGGRPKAEQDLGQNENQMVLEVKQTKAKKPDNENENDNENDIITPTVSVCDYIKTQTHTHDNVGVFKNVEISTQSLRNFRQTYGKDADDIINQLSESIQIDPEKYKGNHYAWLLKFARNYRKPKEQKPTSGASYDISLAEQKAATVPEYHRRERKAVAV